MRRTTACGDRLTGAGLLGEADQGMGAGSSYAGTNRIKFSGTMASTTSQPDAFLFMRTAQQGTPEQSRSIGAPGS